MITSPSLKRMNSITVIFISGCVFLYCGLFFDIYTCVLVICVNSMCISNEYQMRISILIQIQCLEFKDKIIQNRASSSEFLFVVHPVMQPKYYA